MKNRNKEEVYGVIGLGRFGYAVARELALSGAEVLVVDAQEEIIRNARQFTENAFVSDDLGIRSLQQMGFGECTTVIVCIGGKIDVNLLTVLNVVNLGVPHVIAKAVSEDHGALLEKIGAEVIYPERDMGLRLAKRLRSRSVMDYITLSSEVSITEVRLPKSLGARTLGNLQLRKNYGLNVIAIRRGQEPTIELGPSTVLQEGDLLLLIGKNADLERFLEDNR